MEGFFLNEPDDVQPPALPVRADARRNLDALLRAAMEVFQEQGVEAPVRDIARRAGVGVGTLYRHFPHRSDLIVAIVRKEVDACADIAHMLAQREAPFDALAAWLQRLVDMVATKRGLATVLHSGASAYQALPDYFHARLAPVMLQLLEAATATGEVREDVDGGELLMACMRLAAPAADGDMAQARRMVALLADGLRYRVTPAAGGAGSPA